MLVVVAITGRTDWSIFVVGEALLLGGEDDNNWVDIGTGSECGWDYLWVKQDEEVVGDRVLRTPAVAYVEQVQPKGNANTLGNS